MATRRRRLMPRLSAARARGCVDGMGKRNWKSEALDKLTIAWGYVPVGNEKTVGKLLEEAYADGVRDAQAEAAKVFEERRKAGEPAPTYETSPDDLAIVVDTAIGSLLVKEGSDG